MIENKSYGDRFQDEHKPIQKGNKFQEEQQDAIRKSLFKDTSKKIRRFPSGAVRSDNTGRERPDYISPYAIKAIGEHFANNKNDFGAINYFKGIPETAVLESVYRHYLDLQIAILEGDTERIREDWKALAANCIMGLHTHEIIRLGLYKEVFEKTELINIEENDSTI